MLEVDFVKRGLQRKEENERENDIDGVATERVAVIGASLGVSG